MASSPAFTATPNVGIQTIEAGDTTTVLDVFTAGASGSRIDQIFAVHDDTTAVIVKLYVYDGAEAHYLGMISMGVASAPVPFITGDFLQLAAWGGSDACLILPAGYKLQAGVSATLTAGKKCAIYAAGGDF